MATLDEQKKIILPFLQRAQEVEKAEPRIAYYCRMYALEQGMDIRKDVRAPEITGLLEAVMDKLEKDRAVLQLGKDDATYCENFALTVFNRADRVDRAGRADRTTGLTFYAASYFFEILRHFGEPQPDTLQKQRYAAWRATEISKAVKEGRRPDLPPALQAETDEATAMLAELAKLEAGGTSSSALASASPAPPVAQAGWGSPAALDAVPPPPLQQSSASGPAYPALDGGGSSKGGDVSPPPLPPPPGSSFPAIGSNSGGVGGGRGVPCSDSSASLDLPSPPKQRPVDAQASGGAWLPPPLARFHTFQKVLFRADSGAGVARGTVAKVEAGLHPERPKYLVALTDRIAAAVDAASLAPELTTGDAVVYHSPSGQSVQAAIVEMDLSHWPPSYLVRLADGSYVDTTADRVQQLNAHRPTAEAAGPGMHDQQLGPGTFTMAGDAAAAAASPQAHGAALDGKPAVLPPAYHLQPTPLDQQRLGQGSWQPPPPPAMAAATVPAAAPGFQPGLREITEAAKLTKSAGSALQFEDVATAVRLLSQALGLLTQPSPPPGRSR